MRDDQMAVLRHRITILDCLEELDVGLQKKAVLLSFAILNEGNVVVILNDILKYLDRAEPDFKADVCTKIIEACNR